MGQCDYPQLKVIRAGCSRPRPCQSRELNQAACGTESYDALTRAYIDSTVKAAICPGTPGRKMIAPMPFRYLPMLRSKSGEVVALENLQAADKARLFPVIHVAEKPPATFVPSMIKAWSGRAMALDGLFNMNLTGSGTLYTSMFRELGKGGVLVMPSVEVAAPQQYVNVITPLVGRYIEGVTVKAKLKDVSAAVSWIGAQGWPLKNVDLVIDASYVADFDPTMLAKLVVQEITQHIAPVKGWRSVTLAAAAAPKDHGALPRGRTDLPRRDWELWNKVQGAVGIALDYGDYGISHPDMTEPPGIAMSSATVSVRYTTDKNWIVIKGRQTSGQQGQPMGVQYRSHAKTLASDGQFGKPIQTWGDQRIKQIAGGAPKSGSRPIWVQIAVNRHLGLVAAQLP